MPAANAAALANLRKLEVRGRDGPVQKEVLIAWDIENARIPAGVPVEDVEKAIGNAFQYLQRRKRAAFLCAVSPESLETMTRLYGRDQVGYLTQHADLLLAPGGAKSKSTDTKIIKSIEEFINRQSQDGKSATSVLVVITGDDDYTESIRHAMDAGMDVEVLHPDGKTSCNLL